MEYNSATQKLSMLESQFCSHVNTSDVALKLRCIETCYVDFSACHTTFLQSQSDMSILFPNSSSVKVFSMGYRIVTNDGSSSANNSLV
jgi:hypothetical protein